jgi:flagellum-specific peptidoglycan hydrolase FlgJ
MIMTRKEYIEKYRGMVLEAVKGTGLFPSLMMAQAILESSDRHGVPGNSSLARLHNNHFGIKANKAWLGPKVNLKTREVIDGSEVVIGDYFRVYEDAGQSFKDRVTFLQGNQRYTKHGVFTAKTPGEQAEALQRAGYATDPNYASILKNLISRLNLEELDKVSS